MNYIEIKNEKRLHHGIVRKTDLNLRAEFPELQTIIYQVEDDSFVIQIKNRKVDYHKIEAEFEKSIKPILVPINLSRKKPKEKFKILSSLEDVDIPKGLQGVLMPKFRWADMLMSKFPGINFYKISDEPGVVNIHIANYWYQSNSMKKYQFLTKNQKEDLVEFLKNYKSGIDFRIYVDELDSASDHNGHSKDGSSTYYCNRVARNIPKFVQRDESLWYDNVDSIFESNFKKKQLFFYNQNEYSCYADFSVYPNIDLRYFLLLYQRIYLSPPIDNNLGDWFKAHSMSRAEFIELIIRERITILLVQDVSRYDTDFLNEVFSLKPDAIVSKRAIACLQQCDIIETSDNYLFGDGVSIKEMKFVSEMLSKYMKTDASSLFKTLAWPVVARRKSFDVLQIGGVLSASVYGVNKIISNPPETNISEASEFMLNVFSYASHLSSSLNATYFPVRGKDGFTDATYTEQMGTLLNFYKKATVEGLKNFVEGQQYLIKGNTFIEPIQLLKINDYPPILEFEDVLNKELVFPSSKRLMETLANLNGEEQQRKIKMYNDEINKFLGTQEKTGLVLDLGTQTLNIAIGLASGVPTGPLTSLLKLMSKKPMKRLNPVRGLLEKVELAMNQNEEDTRNIHFLSRINRVAKLKEY
ncbi:hypothetical protein BST97_13310 [Nonlabens spongiae]|uniref:Uncharacterized protein n=1 Tax=Nonlabens spongiae TaxID=331648 RepID=A0A1W6MMS5_9FLAO|nr:hypothetical protein [Nonlabens spongiae]ARN78887.1 hypothetical protein BST97_13310 [Nonlabens spongiae]